jgi:phosphatidylinositol alpha-1,6-mannosyltransferase
MTTLLITEVFPPKVGGSGRWLWEVYRRLPDEQLVIAAGECPGQAEFDRGHGLRLTRFPLSFPCWGLLDRRARRKYWSLFRTLSRLARAERIRAVHCGKCLPEGLLGLAMRYRAGLPYTCFVHGEELTIAADSRELTFLTGRVLRGAQTLVANSRNTARLLTMEWGVRADRVAILYPGVDTARFVPGTRSAATRARLDWGDRPVVLTVGRLVPRKGQDMMIRALPAIRERVPTVLYAVVGNGEERARLEALVEREGVRQNVQFLGEIPDEQTIECYQQCDLFALPNRQVGPDIEGFGMVLVEAQACGRPVLAGASGGTAETMRPGETGVVVPCESPGSVAAAVVELLRDPLRLDRMGAAGRELVLKHFDWGALTRRAADLLGFREPAPAG